MFVVDEHFAEKICSMPWRKASDGYLVTGSGGVKQVLMHRLVWQLEYGELPERIDHINRCPWDNRICNLRATTQTGNMHNSTRRRATNSLPPGVHLRVNSQTKKVVRGLPYESYCQHRGVKYHLGYFASAEEAGLVYQQAKINFIQQEEAQRDS
jgi:hypothetical protein